MNFFLLLWIFLDYGLFIYKKGYGTGKKSFTDEQLLKNYNAVLDALEKEKSNNTLKGDLVKNTFITSSMGVSYKLKLSKAI